MAWVAVKHLLLAGVVTFPSCWSLLPHGEINFKSELCLLVFVCWAVEGHDRNAGQIVEEHDSFRLAVEHRRNA
jgi:hypothetical protein